MDRFELGARLTTTSLPLNFGFLGTDRGFDFRKAQKNATKNIGQKPFCHENTRSGSAVLIGSGPSAELSGLPPGDIIAVGAQAGARLNAIGRKPDFLIVNSLDIERLPPAQEYLISRHCNPVLFRRYGGCMISPNPGERIGQRAADLAYLIGYRELHFIGFDASGEGDGRVSVGGRFFRSTPELIYQTLQMIPQLVRFADANGKVFIYGDGLFPYVFRKMHSDSEHPVNHMAVHLDGSIDINFDIVTCIINARIASNREGITAPVRVRFFGALRNSTMKAFHKKQILDNVIRPSMPLLGAVEDNEIATDRVYSACYKTIHWAAQNGEEVPRYRIGGIERDPKKLSITLREAEYATERNTQIDNWKEFAHRREAEGYKVVFVRDTAKADVPLAGFETLPAASKNLIERAKLYESCGMNFGTSNGPMTILWFSDNPFMNFVPLEGLPHYGPAKPEWWKQSSGILPPEQFAWFNADQQIVWKLDNLDNIEEAWTSFRH